MTNFDFIKKVVELVNIERAKLGLSALTFDSQLSRAAQGHSQDMALQDYFAHDGLDGSSFSDRIQDAGYAYSASGENIAAGYSTPESVVVGWMNSPNHKANILNSNFKNIGVGYYYLENDTGSSNYFHYWTQDFGTRSSAGVVIKGIDGNETLQGGDGGDTIKGFAGRDVLFGNAGDDLIIGNLGKDKLYAGPGHDTLFGNAGLDTLTGGEDSDVFMAQTQRGVDKVTDFQNGIDLIKLGAGIDSSNLMITQGTGNQAADTLLSVNDQLILILLGIDANTINATDFV